MASEGNTQPRVLRATEVETRPIGGIDVRRLVAAVDTGGRCALVEHPLPPRSLGAPLHRHSREDEYSFVVEGEIGALLGEEVVTARAGDVVFKPRGQWHAFWNPADEPGRILELISPGGFEDYFAALSSLLGEAMSEQRAPDAGALGALATSYGLELKPDSIPELVERFGLTDPRGGP